MIRLVIVPLLGCLLIVMQLSLSHLIFGGTIGIELSLLLVVYAGFHGTVLRGAALACVLGFVLDSLTVAMPCFFACYYITVFLIATALSTKVFSESALFLAAFCVLATIFEGVFVSAVGRIIHGTDMAHVIFTLYLPQAILCGVAGPPCFMVFSRIEAFIDGKSAESAAQL